MNKFLNDHEHRLDEFLDMFLEVDSMTKEQKVIEEAMSDVMLANEFIKARSLRSAKEQLEIALKSLEKAKKLWDANKLTLDQEFMVVEAMFVFNYIY